MPIEDREALAKDFVEQVWKGLEPEAKDALTKLGAGVASLMHAVHDRASLEGFTEAIDILHEAGSGNWDADAIWKALDVRLKEKIARLKAETYASPSTD